MKIRFLCFVFALCFPFFCTTLRAQTVAEKPVAPAPAGLRLQLSAPKTNYALGEPIAVTMRYTLDGDETLNVQVMDADRSGRVAIYSFYARDAKGNAVRDPAPQLVVGGMGGAVYSAKLSRETPFEQTVIINQWLAFDAPGTYFVRAYSTILRRAEAGSTPSLSSPAIELDSEPLQIEIAPPNEASRQEQLKWAAVILSGVDSDRDMINRHTREQTVRELRYLLDERAIPILVRSLGDGFVNVQFEAELGLLAFEDLAPVKAEIWRAVEDDEAIIEPRTKYHLMRILGAAAKRAPQDKEKTPAEFWPLLNAKIARQLQTGDAGQQAQKIVEAMSAFQISRADVDNWNRVLSSAVLMPEKLQKDAAEILSHQMNVNPQSNHRLEIETLRALKTAMTAVAGDEKINGLLRSACIVGLFRIGDNSFRDLLVREFQASIPTLWDLREYRNPWKSAQKELGDYQSKEIAQSLLAQFNETDLTRPVPNHFHSVLLRLIDFGQFLSLEELEGVMRRLSATRGYYEELFKVLALKSSEAVVPFIREMPLKLRNGDKNYYRRDIITSVLTRLDSPSARALVTELLASPDAEDRGFVISGFAQSAQQDRKRAEQLKRYGSVKLPDSNPSRLPIRPDLAHERFPEILHLFETDPSPQVRAAALYALTQISDIGPKYYENKPADYTQFLAQWKQ